MSQTYAPPQVATPAPEPPAPDQTDHGSNAANAAALDHMEFSDDEASAQEEADRQERGIFEFTEEDASVLDEVAKQEALQAQVDAAEKAWALSLQHTIDNSAARLGATGDQSQEALSAADSSGFESAVDAADAQLVALESAASAPKGSLDALIEGLGGQGADVGLLTRVRDEALPAIVPTATTGFGEKWLIWRYKGSATTVQLQSYRTDYPPMTGDSAKDVDRWRKYLVVCKDRFLDILVEGAQTREFARGLPAWDEAHFGTWKGMNELWAIKEDNPAENEEGRYKDYCDAVVEGEKPEWAEALNRESKAHTGHQVQAEDAEGRIDWEEMDEETLASAEWEGEIDFGDLDEGIGAIGSELQDTFVDDDVMMDALDRADTDVQRDYMLRRLRAQGDYSDMVREFDGSDVEDFEEYRKSSVAYADDDFGAAAGPTIGGALKDAGRLAPGAVASVGAGMTYGIPILGDIIEKEYGEDINAGIGQMHKEMGVDERSAATSMTIGTGMGKVATGIGTAAAGGGATNVIKGVSKLGTMGKIGTTALGAADLGNNAYQVATGEKITSLYTDEDDKSDDLSLLERGAAGLGFLGGVADVGGSLLGRGAANAGKAHDTMRGMVDVGDDAAAMPLQLTGAARASDMSDLARAHDVQTFGADAAGGFGKVMGYGGAGAKITDAHMKDAEKDNTGGLMESYASLYFNIVSEGL